MASGNRPYSSRPKTARRSSAGDATFDEPTPAERRRMDEEQAAPYREAYKAGEKAAREKGQKRGPTKPGAKKPGPAQRRMGPRRPPPSVRKAGRQLAAPVRAQLTSGFQLAGMALGLVALYAVLTNAPAFAGVLGGISRGLSWLAAPDRTVPSRP